MQDLNAPIIEVSNLSKRVRSGEADLTILSDLSLSVSAAATVSIMGASGSGKSTLLSLLAGLDTPSSGQIKLANTELTTLDEDGRALLRAKYVGFVFQAFQLIPSLTALENVMLPLELAQVKTAKQQALNLLEQVGLAARGHHYPRQLSGGEQQRVAIARAFSTQPKILFADEVTGNLDPKTGAHIIELLFALNQQYGTTLILVTHDVNLAKQCQQQYVLQDGKLV